MIELTDNEGPGVVANCIHLKIMQFRTESTPLFLREGFGESSL
jgi:hypothetical protein